MSYSVFATIYNILFIMNYLSLMYGICFHITYHSIHTSTFIYTNIFCKPWTFRAFENCLKVVINQLIFREFTALLICHLATDRMLFLSSIK